MKFKEKISQQTLLIAVGTGLTAILLGAILMQAFSQKPSDSENSTPSPTAQVSPSPSETPQQPASPSADSSPTPSPTSTAQANLPAGANTVLANFYAAYASKDRTRMAASFSADSTAELQSLNARHFTGFDIDGSPGGPTLFSTNSANQVAVGYQVLSVIEEGKRLAVTIQEQRQDGSGLSIPPVTTVVTLVPGSSPSGSYFIDEYRRTGTSGKYEALMNE